jgi:hypothetical protein
MHVFVSPKGLQGIDESIRTGLESTRDGFFFWLVFSSFVVAAGLVLEAPELFHEIRNLSRPESIPRPWKKVVGFVGWVLIVAGCLGEGIAESLTSKVDGLLQSFNDILLADSFRQSSTAYTQAQYAERSAANAKDSADAANAVAGNAKSSARDAQQSADNSSQLTLQTETKLEDEHKKRMELEQSLAPRVLELTSDPSSPFNTSTLQPFRGTEAIIEAIPDAEAMRAARNLATVLEHGCGWKVILPIKLKSPESIPDGVTIFSYFSYSDLTSPAAEKSSKTADALEKFLERINWEANSYAGHDLQPGQLRISVGLKPDAYFEPEWVKAAREQKKKIDEMRK